jgi:curved DNA-binding protein CbpA
VKTLSSQPFDPDKIIDYSKDYYAILGLERGCLPEGSSRNDKMKTAEILETAFRVKARTAHPDFGGSKEQFLDIIRARRILEDPLLRRIWESNGEDKPRYVGDGANQFEVDWSKLGTYRKGTPEDTVGYGLFLDIAERKQELNLVPAFYPSTPEDNYQWDFVLPDKGVKLALAVVNDENEVLRLTSGEQMEEALPFKIFICIPRGSLYLLRDQDTRIESPFGKTIVNGQLLGAAYSDFNLLETTSLKEAHAYIAPGGKLERDLEAFRDGSMIRDQARRDAQNKQQVWLGNKEIQEIDREQLKHILRMRSFEVVPDPKAADFLDSMPDVKSSRKPKI